MPQINHDGFTDNTMTPYDSAAFIAFIELVKAIKEIGEVPASIDPLLVELKSNRWKKFSTFWRPGGWNRLRMALDFIENPPVQYCEGLLVKEKRASKALIKGRLKDVFVFCGSDERINNAIAQFKDGIIQNRKEKKPKCEKESEHVEKPKRGKKSEHVEQTEFVKAAREIMFEYRIPKTVLFAIPNGVPVNKRIGARLKAEGVVAGVPDLMFAQPMSPFGGLFIEMKREHGGCPSQKQKILHKDLASRGYAVAICHGCKEAVEVLKKYLSLNISIRKKHFPNGRWIKNKIPKI